MARLCDKKFGFLATVRFIRGLAPMFKTLEQGMFTHPLGQPMLSYEFAGLLSFTDFKYVQYFALGILRLIRSHYSSV